MTNHVYKVIEIVGSSETSIEDAINTAIAEANKSVSMISAGTAMVSIERQ